MKATGIVRHVDDLGRIVIPKEIRRKLQIHDGNAMEIFVTDGGVLFKKYDTENDIVGALRTLKECVSEADDLNHRGEMLDKIKELNALLKNEQSEED
ncbi:MAG: AbrB/MazE/SpoVT family DNA-binding domain-containing protein [Bacteroides sp.]